MLAAAFFSVCGPASADILEDFASICLAGTSTTPAGLIATGEAYAGERNWQPDKVLWGRRYGIKGPDWKEEPPVFDVREWNFEAIDGGSGRMQIWVIGPEWSAVKFNSCAVSAAGRSSDAVLPKVATVLKLRVEDAIVAPGQANIRGWMLAQSDTPRAKAEKYVLVTEQQSQSGWWTFVGLIDNDLPKDPKVWPHQGIFP